MFIKKLEVVNQEFARKRFIIKIFFTHLRKQKLRLFVNYNKLSLIFFNILRFHKVLIRELKRF